MLIKPEEINVIIRKAGDNTAAKGKKYFEEDKVKIKKVKYLSDENFKVQTYVRGTYIYEPFIYRDKGVLKFSCNCPTFTTKNRICKHIVATTFDMYVTEEKYREASNKDFTISISEEEKLEKNRYKNKLEKEKEHIRVLDYYENLSDELLNAKFNVNIVPILEEPAQDELSVYFRIGSKKMYNIKNLEEFASAIKNEDVLEHGKDFAFKHSISNFNDNSKAIAKFISRKILEYSNYNSFSKTKVEIMKDYRKRLMLKYSALDEFFNLYENTFVEFEDKNRMMRKIKFLYEDPILNFNIEEKDESIIITHDYSKYKIYYGASYIYILLEDTLYKCSKDFQTNMLVLLEEFRRLKNDTISIKLNNAAIFTESVIPAIEKFSTIKMDDDLKQKYKSKNLGVKVFLDIDNKKNIIASVRFCYENQEFNPIEADVKISSSRNKRQEERVKKLFNEYKFLIDKDKKVLYLKDEDDIYQFFKTGIDKFMEKFEVLVTDKLKNKNILNLRVLNMGVRLDNNLIDIDLNNTYFDEKELKEIFSKYKLKKKYYRLKDGSFIDLESSLVSTLYNFSEGLGIKPQDIAKGKIKVPKYRAVYLDSLSKNNDNVVFEKDAKFNSLISDISNSNLKNYEIPTLNCTSLREYQKVGFSWLKSLSEYGFGGILADDMGLGKTIQIIALLKNAKLNSLGTSIVICPSSLYINWENEIKKFAPEIKTKIINGSVSDREKKISNIEKYDVIITSYDLLKRDIAEYESINFKYIIADEAQYIKNNNTKNAKSIKELKGDIRFALTGTPIENSLSELWSIFDFIMPGYLYSYKKFKEMFETPIIKDSDIDISRKLQNMVAPFILRRTKSEVLKELPEKVVSIMYNEMNEEQSKIYKTYSLSAKREVKKELEENNLELSNMKILSLITRLRQIASHPSLFLEDYAGESSKVNQCMELVKEAYSSGHKMLIFSSFTSIFDILEEELNKNNIKYFKLTGKTKVDVRVNMVDEFNKSKDVQIFLVSLKAGGTGLNLVGADMVIHFDPWWNLSQENQATDRAYRIGQRNNVQVFKLITKNTIEEKIQDLQDKKSKIIDDIIKSGETFISKMSKEDILELFT